MACHRIFVCSLFLLQLLMLVSAISSSHSSSKPLQGSWEHSPTKVLITKNDDDAFSGKGVDNNYNVGGRKMAGVKTAGAANWKKEGVVKVGGVELSKKKHSVGFGGEGDEVKKQEAGFVAFNEDYHAPRHHPPKNN